MIIPLTTVILFICPSGDLSGKYSIPGTLQRDVQLSRLREGVYEANIYQGKNIAFKGSLIKLDDQGMEYAQNTKLFVLGKTSDKFAFNLTWKWDFTVQSFQLVFSDGRNMGILGKKK